MKKNILAKSVNSICKYMLAGVMLTSGIIAAAGENKVVASSGILGDITKQIAGDKVKVTTIVPVDSDPHAYDLTPANMIDLDKGNLIIINGLGFEGYLERYLNQDKFKNKIVVASKGVSAENFPEGEHHHDHDADEHEEHHHDHEASEHEEHHHDHDADEHEEHHHDHDESGEHKGHHHHHHNGLDPHAWQNPLNGVIYANNIADALCRIDKDDCAYFRKNAEQYTAGLIELDSLYAKKFASVPKDRRVLITTHEAFGYFAIRYDVTIMSPLGISTGSEVSAKRIAELKDVISKGHVQAIFMERNGNNSLINQIGGDKVANKELFSDMLAPEGEGSTYKSMLEHNLKAIYEAIAPEK